MGERLIIFVGVELWAYVPNSVRAAFLMEVHSPALLVPTVMLQANPNHDPATNTNTFLIGALTLAITIVGWLLNRSIREMDERHKTVEQKVSILMDKADGKFYEMENKLSRIKEEAHEIKLKVNGFEHINKHLENQINSMQEERKEIQKENKSFMNSFNHINAWIQKLQDRGYFGNQPPKEP